MPRMATTLVLAVSMGAVLWTRPAGADSNTENVSETPAGATTAAPEPVDGPVVPRMLAADADALPVAVEPDEASRPQPVPVDPAGANPLATPARVTTAGAGDELLGALWNMQERLDQLERENARLHSNLDQLQAQPAWHGRSSRFFQVSPVRAAGFASGGAVPMHYQSELAALEESSQPAALPPGAMPLLPHGTVELPMGGYECGAACGCGAGAGCRGCGHAGGAGDNCFAGVFELSIDWLNWKTNRDGLDFVVTGDDNDVLGPGSLKHVRQDRDNGLRVALFRRLHSGWDFGVRYTEFDFRGSNSAFDPAATMTPTRIHPSLGGADIRDEQIAIADSSYDLKYEIYDVEAGRTFGIGASGAVRPFAAVRSARIDQTLLTRYSDTPDFTGNVVIVNEIANTSSVGMLLGSEAHWHIREIWSLFGRAAGGLHVGTSDVSHVELEPDDGDVNVQVREDLRQVLFSFETAAGVSCRVWDGRPAAVDLQVGYEIQYWDNLPDFMRFVDDANEGVNDRSTTSLGLDGFFGRVVITR